MALIRKLRQFSSHLGGSSATRVRGRTLGASRGEPSYQPRKMPILIGGMGGLGSGGRPESAFRWTVFEHLTEGQRRETLLDTLRLTGLIEKRAGGQWQRSTGEMLSEEEALRIATPEALLKELFIRRVPADRLFDHRALRPLKLTTLTVLERELPDQKNWPLGWEHAGPGAEPDTVKIRIQDGSLHGEYEPRDDVHFGGFIPEGVNRGEKVFVNAEGQRRDRQWEEILRHTLFAFGDLVAHTAIPIESMAEIVGPTRMGIAFGSAQHGMGVNGLLNLIYHYLCEKRSPSSTAIPFSLADMPVSFASLYALGPRGFLGPTSALVAACSTFLANLELSLLRLRGGRTDIEFTGAADFANVPWNRNGFSRAAMVCDENLENPRFQGFYQPSGEILYHRASNPFGRFRNGFVISEGAYGVTLFTPEAAYRTGAEIWGAIDDVYCFSDGPGVSSVRNGVGLTIAWRHVMDALLEGMGPEALARRTFAVAHDTSTEQNSPREATALQNVAAFYGINEWPITAPKSWFGHSEGASGGENLLFGLYGLREGIIPGIRNLKESGLGEDLGHTDRLRFLMDPYAFAPGEMIAACLASMGFGSKNAVASLISGEAARHWFEEIYLQGTKRDDYRRRVETTRQARSQNEEAWLSGAPRFLYQEGPEFSPEDVTFESHGLRIRGRPQGEEVPIGKQI